ncbi:MAG: hypothetical protein ACREM1_15530 [Longimicrobiales bacterium]
MAKPRLPDPERDVRRAKAPENHPRFVPKHGKGMLLRRGVKGNVGGLGNVSAIRQRVRGSLSERVPILEEIADGTVKMPLLWTCSKCGYTPPGNGKQAKKIEEAAEAAVANMISSADRLRALELMAKIGLTGERVSVENIRLRLQRTIEIIEEVLEPEAATALKQRLVDVWK